MARGTGHTTTLIRSMEVGQMIELPIDKWGAARNVASYTNKIFGSVYHVRKKDEWTVTVTRTH